ncbi:transducin family protein / WD-40 repeat family protein [Striga asiatica]|uniref:Transducin family protein / WD-40 repeat family protein n=1 Tax=Striga asiatica TaxID=4170 RepID=A0A5A7RFT1_STRAF|nr:transducin family protein / WD-40 repeat family protein [Striga asiatica]
MAKQTIVLPLIVFFLAIVYAAPFATAARAYGPTDSGESEPPIDNSSNESLDYLEIPDTRGIIGPLSGGPSPYADMLGSPVPYEFYSPPDPTEHDPVPTAYEDYAFVPTPAPAPAIGADQY